MQCISLNKLIPSVFEDEGMVSQVWLKDLAFEKGQRYLIEAASGTGKTSLCSFIYGDRRDFRGDILFDNSSVRILDNNLLRSYRERNLSVVFQDLKLFPELTALENVIVKNQLTNYKTIEQIRQLFDSLGLSHRIDTPASKLSLGQQQRVSFIRALCQPFDFIILDEPISHLDMGNADIISQILETELSERGASAIVTSLGVTLNIRYDKRLKL